MAPEPEKPQSVAEAIDTIEATYELTLAYAAQGRRAEEDDPLGLRQALRRADVALDVLRRRRRPSSVRPAAPPRRRPPT